jgi:hypothetical protein
LQRHKREEQEAAMKSSDNRRVVTEVFLWLLILFALAVAAPSLRA